MGWDNLFFGKSEAKVGVSDLATFRDEMCKLDSPGQIKMLQNMSGDKNLQIKVDAGGSLEFPGQFVIGSISGAAYDNHFNFGYSEADKKVVIHDSHNNVTTIGCGEAVAGQASGDLPKTGTAREPGAGELTDERLAEALRRAGLDPKTLRPISKDDTSGGVMDTKIEMELPDKLKVTIDQLGDQPPTITGPGAKEVEVKEAADGGLEIKFGGVVYRVKDGSLSSDQSIDGVKIQLSATPVHGG